MAYVTGRMVAPILLPCFGSFFILFGFMFGYIIGPIDTVLNLIGNILLMIGLLMVLSGAALYPGSRRESKKIRSILEIVAVRKEVTISDISAETGLDREYIRRIITNMLIAHTLFGYLEDDLFVRDTSGRPLFYAPGRMGMFEPRD